MFRFSLRRFNQIVNSEAQKTGGGNARAAAKAVPLTLQSAGLVRDDETGLVSLRDPSALRVCVKELYIKKESVTELNRSLKLFPPTLKNKILTSIPKAASVEEGFTNISSYISSSSSNPVLQQKELAENLDLLDSNIQLSADQKTAIHLALKGHNLVLGGSAGTGKSVAIREIVRNLRARGLNVTVTATTGVAACHIDGSTFQRMFGLMAQRGTPMKTIDTLIVDEASMMSFYLFEKFNLRAQRVRHNSSPFGGIQVILVGDFLQLGTVPRGESLFRSKLFHDHFLHLKMTTLHRFRDKDTRFMDILQQLRLGKFPKSFDPIQIIAPNQPLPQLDDATYLFMLNKDVSKCNELKLAALPGDSILFHSTATDVSVVGIWTDTHVVNMTNTQYKSEGAIEALIKELEEQVLTLIPWHDTLQGKVVSAFKVASRANEVVYGFRAMLSRESGDESQLADLKKAATALLNTFFAKRKISVARTQPPEEAPLGISERFDSEIAKEVLNAGVELKVGARVMLRWNFSSTLCNGSLGEVVGFTKLPQHGLHKGTMVVCGVQKYTQFMSQKFGQNKVLYPLVKFHNGEEFVVPPIAMPYGGTDAEHYFVKHLVAFPIQLGYAFTVHKVQGLTLNTKVVFDLSKSFWCPHIVYVGVSRVPFGSQLILRGLQPRHVCVDTDSMKYENTIPAAGTIEIEKVSPHTLSGTYCPIAGHVKPGHKKPRGMKRRSKKYLDVKEYMERKVAKNKFLKGDVGTEALHNL
eukprot:PhF_6_TR35823/c0_g1_i1/m.52043/K15255/PIF1; ATP-dependent DNA helicase PIF1